MTRRAGARRARGIAQAARERLSYANVMATAAMFVALGGSAWAVAANSVGNRQLKQNAVSAAKIKKNAVRSTHIENGTIVDADINARTRLGLRGAQGPSGAPGVSGAQGPSGPPGVSGYEVVSETGGPWPFGGANVDVLCPAGKRILGGGGFLSGDDTVVISESNVLRRSGDDALLDGWHVHGQRVAPTNSPMWTLRVDAICASVG